MSVFTVVDADDVADWLDACGAGTLVALEGVAGGVENTNYHVRTDRGEFALTIFEWMSEADATRSLSLTAALADAGLPVARPWRQLDGWLAPLEGKQAALSRWIPGAHPGQPTVAQCRAIGGFLARLHSADIPGSCGPDPRGAAWRGQVITHLTDALDADARGMVDAAAGLPLEREDLPTGPIHADLFRDNALFDGDTLCGVVDFHYACTGVYIDDVAVAALDWCFDGPAPDALRLRAMCDGYASIRAPSPDECAHFPVAVVRAALRFWLSRLHDRHHPRPGKAVTVKEPGEMSERLRTALRAPVDWPA